MTNTTNATRPNREDQYAEAAAKRDAARLAWQNAKTKKAAREADEELQFWVGRCTMLSNPVGWAS